jgi:uncharacterized protein involved in outer membrane biogenesis
MSATLPGDANAGRIDTGSEPLRPKPSGASGVPRGGPRRGHPWRWVAGVLAVIILAIAIFLALFNWDWFRPPLAKMLSGRLHRPVRIVGHLKVHLFSWTPSATLGGLQIGEPDWAPKQDLADIAQITAKVQLMPLFTGKVILPLIQLDQPKVSMFQDKTGRTNWDFSNGAAPGKPAKLPAIQNFIINDGTLNITSLQRKLKFCGTVNAHEAAVGGGKEGFRLAGKGSLNAKPFLMNVTGGPLLNVKPNVAYPFDADVTAGDTRVTAKGKVPHPFNLGQVEAAVSMSGRNLADLYYLTGVTLPNTPTYSIAGDLSRNEMVYDLTAIKGRIGGSDLEGSLKADMANKGRPDVTADLQSRVLDFKDLGSLFGATGANKPGAVHLVTDAPTAAANRRLLPDAPLDVERVRGMDADVHYHALSVLAPGLPLKQVSLGVKLDHGLLNLDPIEFSFPQGKLAGTAAIDARTAVQKDAIDLRVTGVKIQEFLTKSKAAGPPPVEGTLDARAKMSGTGDSVHKAAASSDGEVTLVIPGGVVRQVFAELLGIDATKGLFMLLSKDQHQTDIRCAVADFRVHDGNLQAQQILIDTDVVAITGAGNINLNDETLNLAFSGKPKKFRLIRIDAPITIGGHLTSPAFGIKPAGALAQAGGAVVLAAAINPLLAILPFVNFSYAHDANCTGLLSVARSLGAPVKVSDKGSVQHSESKLKH